MCLMNQKPIVYEPCIHCPEYLTACMPIVADGYIYGECDQSFCEWCSLYEECMKGGIMDETIKL